MADPRDTVSFEGLHQRRATFEIDGVTITREATVAHGTSHVGKAVTLSAADTVALADDGEAVIGRLEAVEAGDKAIVTVSGYVVLPGGNGATLTLGSAIVGAQDASTNPGYIRSANSAVAAEMVVARGFIQNAGTPASTIVRL
jgi:hypothetical protein